MEMTIIYIVLIALLLGLIWHIFCNLMIVFHKDATDLCVKKILENPYEYIRNEEMCNFLRNMTYLFFVVEFLLAGCKGNIRFEKNTKTIETSIVKDK